MEEDSIASTSSLLHIDKRTVIMGKNIELNYQKLVVPMKMRSIYWKGFGFPANVKGEILTKDKIVCLFCRAAIAYNRNTSNLRMHLESKHREKLLEFEELRPAVHETEKKCLKRPYPESPVTVPTITAANVGGTIKMYSPSPNQLSKNKSSTVPELVEIIVPKFSEEEEEQVMIPSVPSEESSLFETMLTEFLVTDLVSPHILQGSGFQHLLNTLRPDMYKVDRDKVENELLPQCHSTLKDAIIQEMKELLPVGVSLEEWKSGCGRVYMTISAHFVKDGTSLEMRVLSTLDISTKSKRWLPLFLSTLSDWGIEKEHVLAVVVAAIDTKCVVHELRSVGFKVVHCLDHALQQAVSKCFAIEVVSCLIEKCYSLFDQLKSLQSIFSQEDEPIIKFPNVWTTTYEVLSFLMCKKSMIQDSLGIQEEVKLSDEEWETISTINGVLQPFTLLLDTLHEESVPSIALIKPLLLQIANAHLKTTTEENELNSVLKNTMLGTLTEFYSDDDDVDLMLKTASFLDPRFKNLSYDDEATTEHVKKSLESMQHIDDLAETPESKPRLSSIGLLLGSLCLPKSATSTSDRNLLELQQYQCEPAIAFDRCPVQWWATASSKCPKLGRLAHNYQCISAIAISRHLLASNKRIEYMLRRSAIEPQFIDKILFLYGNQKLFSFQE